MSEPFGPELTSIRSPKVKAARQLAKRALRQHARSFLAEGPQAVGAALTRSGVVSQLFITAAARARHADLADQAARQGAQVQAVSGEVMAELAQTITPQGVLAVCRYIDIPLARLAASGPRLVVILANVRDPGNAGTVLRTADAAGADGVIFSDATVDAYNSKCVRATAGSLFHLPLVMDVPVAAAVTAMRDAGLHILAADGRVGRSLDETGPGEPDSPLGRPSAWLFGNEAWGLPAGLLALADDAIAVPIYGKAESLNLAAAAAVCLYASARAARAGQDSRAAPGPPAPAGRVPREQ
jgi:RNA methyltransferase, TrmH family